MPGVARPLRPLRWVGSSKRDYGRFPARVQDNLGFALFLVQTGQHPPAAKPLKGLGSGVVELVEDFDGDTYRAVYTVRFSKVVYVLHAFMKKSKRGIKTPKTDIDLIGMRNTTTNNCLKQERVMARKVQVEAGSDNIFADLGLPDAETHLLKAQIVSEIYRLTQQRKLTQAQAGKRMGISQPEVSRMFGGNFREYSVDRLMEFLTRFDRDIEIVVKPHKKTGRQGRITFIPPAA
jgi:phage-related protein/predicted XRE-type DNA-binding protein